MELSAIANPSITPQKSDMPCVIPPSRNPRYPEFPTIVHALAHAGYTFLVDRKKEMIIAGGYNV
jgi:hypothetical protein